MIFRAGERRKTPISGFGAAPRSTWHPLPCRDDGRAARLDVLTCIPVRLVAPSYARYGSRRGVPKPSFSGKPLAGNQAAMHWSAC